MCSKRQQNAHRAMTILASLCRRIKAVLSHELGQEPKMEIKHCLPLPFLEFQVVGSSVARTGAEISGVFPIVAQ